MRFRWRKTQGCDQWIAQAGPLTLEVWGQGGGFPWQVTLGRAGVLRQTRFCPETETPAAARHAALMAVRGFAMDIIAGTVPAPRGGHGHERLVRRAVKGQQAWSRRRKRR